MKVEFKEFLFNRHIMVAEPKDVWYSAESFNALVTMHDKLGIKITKGHNLANLDLVKFAELMLGEYIPEPFYRGFPETVREMTQDQLLFDQLLHYFQTYGCDDFDEAGHSLFEENFERLVFKEDFEPKKFEILTEKEATVKLVSAVMELLKSSRPLSESDYDICKEVITEYKTIPDEIPCKQTAIRLLYDTKEVNTYAKFISLPDVVKLVDYINYSEYANENLKKLNFSNQDRRLVTKVIDYMFDHEAEIKDCFEKKQIWCGLLHHIHYQPKNVYAEAFVNMIRGKTNLSAYSQFEKALAINNPVEAAKVLVKNKGTSVLIRNLNYILSRCDTEEQVKEILKWVS